MLNDLDTVKAAQTEDHVSKDTNDEYKYIRN